MYGRIMYGTVKYGNKTRNYPLAEFIQAILVKTRGLVKRVTTFSKAKPFKSSSKIIV
jgi:hypothetical protein